MSKKSGLGDNLYVGGYNLSGDIGSISRISGNQATLDVTGIDKEAYERIGGKRDGAIEFSSFFNDAAGHSHLVLRALPTADVAVTYCRGTTLGNPAACLIGKQINYDPTLAADGALTIATSAQANRYGLEWGIQLTPGIKQDTTATNGTSIDGGAATTEGAQAYLQVFAITGTSATIKVQDSADNVTFADVTGLSFTAATGITTQRLATAAGATIRRYVRAISTGTFTVADFSVVLVRNETTVTF